MVGEVSPDGKYVWNGVEWIANDNTTQPTESFQEQNSNLFQTEFQDSEQEIGWQPVAEKAEEGGKGKLIAMSVVGLLILTALGWVVYAFVIDPMLYPDPYSKDKFFSVVNDQPTQDDVASGEAGPWICSIEVTMEEEDMKIRSEFDIYASESSARQYSKLSFGIFGSAMSDVWIDDSQIAWQTGDSDDQNSSKIAISGLDRTPAEEIFSSSDDGPLEMCFLHHSIVASMEENPSQKFSSDKERFPDEEGVRAVKVETKMELEGEDGIMNMAVYFDADDNMLGTKVWNSSFESIVTFDSKSFSKPGWVGAADSDTPLLLDAEDSYIYSASHYTEVQTQFNATYSLDDDNLKIVIYEDDYDYENGTDSFTILHEVSMANADDGGAIIQVNNWNDELVNCTIYYADEDSDNQISSGDFLGVDCEQDVLSGYNIGISNQHGLSQQVDMEVPWISPVFTIIALLGAAMLISRRD